MGTNYGVVKIELPLLEDETLNVKSEGLKVNRKIGGEGNERNRAREWSVKNGSEQYLESRRQTNLDLRRV